MRQSYQRSIICFPTLNLIKDPVPEGGGGVKEKKKKKKSVFKNKHEKQKS